MMLTGKTAVVSAARVYVLSNVYVDDTLPAGDQFVPPHRQTIVDAAAQRVIALDGRQIALRLKVGAVEAAVGGGRDALVSVRECDDRHHALVYRAAELVQVARKTDVGRRVPDACPGAADLRRSDWPQTGYRTRVDPFTFVQLPV